jgi:hypothetical protein
MLRVSGDLNGLPIRYFYQKPAGVRAIIGADRSLNLGRQGEPSSIKSIVGMIPIYPFFLFGSMTDYRSPTQSKRH